MTPEEKDLIQQVRSEDAELKARETAMKRMGEVLEESYILDLPPPKAVIQALETMAASKRTPASLRRNAGRLVKQYKI